MEGIRSRYHTSRTSTEVSELSKKQLTVGQKIVVQRTAQAANVEVDFDPNRYDSVKLYVYAYETGTTEPILATLKANAEAVAKESFKKELNEFVAEFESVPNQIGAVVLSDNRVVGIERAPSHDYWVSIWPSFIRECYGSLAIEFAQTKRHRSFRCNIG